MPQNDPTARPDDAADASVPTTLGEGLAAAARKAGLGELAAGDGPTGRALLRALGGVRGLCETVLPGLVFLVVYTFTLSVPLSIGLSVAVAVAFTLARIVRRSSVTQAVAGLIGVGASAVLALISGRGEDNFLLGIWTNAGYAVALLVSVFVRWPIIGLAAGYLMGDAVAWRGVRSRLRIMQALTLMWAILFVARLAVQVPLYLAHSPAATSALALLKLLMGIPLYVPLLLVTVFVVRTMYGAGAPKRARE